MSAAPQQKVQLIVKLSVIKGPHAGQVFNVNKDKMNIGRGPENDIVLMNDPQISRNHAQIILVDREFEIIKLSQKNAIIIQGDSVDKWKLLNNSTFEIGDSEIKIEYDLGQAVVSVPAKKLAEVVQLKPKASDDKVAVGAKPLAQAPASSENIPATTKAPVKSSVQTPNAKNSLVTNSNRSALPLYGPVAQQQPQRVPQQVQQPRVAQQQVPYQSVAVNQSLFDNPKFKFYAIAVIIIGITFMFFNGPSVVGRKAKAKPILKYEDEVDIKLRSEPEKDKVIKREEIKKDRNSPQHLRAEENFIKGMRDYQLGNYARAIEFFQVVLNLESDHVLAKRHLYLSVVRYDELVQTKLMLGESYYNKHNFNMCESMYRQVMDMLDDRKTDTKYKLAESKAKECSLAIEGIR